MNTAEQERLAEMEGDLDAQLKAHYAAADPHQADAHRQGAQTQQQQTTDQSAAGEQITTEQDSQTAQQAGAPAGEEVVDERVKNAQALMTRSTQEAADLRRQVEPLKQENEQLKTQLAQLSAQVQSLQQQPPQAQPQVQQSADSAAGSDGLDAALSKAMEEDPDLVKPLVDLIKHRDQQIEQLDEQLQGLKGTVDTTTSSLQEREQATAAEAHFAKIRAAHPDLDQVTQSPDFQGWVARQPNAVQQAVAQGTADDAVWVLNQYKAAAGIASNNLDAARAAAMPATPRARQQPTQTRPRFTRQQIDAMSSQEYAAKETEIDEALAAGLIG